RELATRAGRPVPSPLDAEGARTWAEFQHRYDAARALIRTAADVTRVVTEAALDDRADGCGWLEVQVDPTSYAPALGGLRAARGAVVRPAAAPPVPPGVSAAPSWAPPPAHATRLARLAAEYAGRGVVGFGLSNDERLGHPADFAPAFRLAADAGLLGTPHAGFYTGADHVRDCVRHLLPARIGHGTSAATDPARLGLLPRQGSTLAGCPT